jgi:hypothetical protein
MMNRLHVPSLFHVEGSFEGGGTASRVLKNRSTPVEIAVNRYKRDFVDAWFKGTLRIRSAVGLLIKQAPYH